MEEDFEKQIRDMVEERNRKQVFENERADRDGEYIYTKFKCWCNAFKNGQGINDARVFAEFVKEEKIELDFWQKKSIAEKYFGYKYKLNNKTLEWELKKERNDG